MMTAQKLWKLYNGKEILQQSKLDAQKCQLCTCCGYMDDYLIIGFPDQRGCIKEFSEHITSFNAHDCKSFRFVKPQYIAVLEKW